MTEPEHGRNDHEVRVVYRGEGIPIKVTALHGGGIKLERFGYDKNSEVRFFWPKPGDYGIRQIEFLMGELIKLPTRACNCDFVREMWIND